MAGPQSLAWMLSSPIFVQQITDILQTVLRKGFSLVSVIETQKMSTFI